MPRFVLLRHECPPSLGKPSHWDLMLEQDGALLTWSLVELPASWRRQLSNAVDADEAPTANSVAAIQLANHRLAYLDYEGPLSDDRGAVLQCDAGEYTLRQAADGLWSVELAGRSIHGSAVLQRVAVDRWRLKVSDA